MYTRVLVPLDGSELGEHALPVAATIARAHAATLHLVHVHLRLVHGGVSPAVGEEVAGRQRETLYLDSTKARVEKEAGSPVAVALLDDPVPHAIGELVASAGVDLIVMTSHGRTGLTRAWMGSVADALVRHASVPVLVVRPPEAAGAGRAEVRPSGAAGFTHVLVPLDGSGEAERILPHAVAVAGTGAHLTLARVVEPVATTLFPDPAAMPLVELDRELLARQVEGAESYLRGLAASLRTRGAGGEVRTVVHVRGHPAAAILESARNAGADLIAMTTHGRGASRLLLGSVADKVLRGTAVPVLVYRPARPDAMAASA